MTLEESRQQADKMFDELETELVPAGWVPGKKGLHHRCNRELFLLASNRALAVVKVYTNAGHGDGSGVPSIRVDRFGASSYYEGASVGDALEETFALTRALTPPKEVGENVHE